MTTENRFLQLLMRWPDWYWFWHFALGWCLAHFVVRGRKIAVIQVECPECEEEFVAVGENLVN